MSDALDNHIAPGGAETESSSKSVPPILEVSDLHVRYGANVALEGASLTVPRGQICGLVGMNGSGKSTLFKAITNSVSYQKGSIKVTGIDANQARKQRLIGYVAQNEEIDWDFPVNVNQVVMMGRYGFMGPTRRPKSADLAAVQAALEMVELQDLQQRQIGALSGGQKKRVFIARAIAQGAPLLLLDEPFAGVDKYSETNIVDLLRKISAKGTTVVVSTHDLASLEKLCDEVVLLYRRGVYQGKPAGALDPQNLAKAFGLNPATSGGGQ